MTPWIALIGIPVVVAAASAWLYRGRSQEVVSEVRVLNPDGAAGTALIVYHPGKGTFQRRVVSGFAEGLVSNGWRVDVATASSQSPTDLSGYDLLVLGTPTYFFSPSRPVLRYVRALGDLSSQRTVVIVTGMGAGQRSASMMERRVREGNGDLAESLLLYWIRPNADDNHVNTEQNRALAVDIARQAGKRIALPGVQGPAV